MMFSLSQLYKQPNSTKVQTLNEKTLALKIMSLDLNSAEDTKTSHVKTGITNINTQSKRHGL